MQRSIVASLLLLLIQPSHVIAQKPANVRDIVDTELAFARAAGQVGVRDAFLQFIDDDGVIFRPRAVNGKQYLTAQAKRVDGFVLQWQPDYADISAAGDIGYTTGPWTIRKTAADTAVAYGEFNTVWLRQPSGAYKFLIDTGASHDKVVEHPLDVFSAPPHVRVPADVTDAVHPLSSASREYVAQVDSALTTEINSGRDLSARLLPHARVTRDGALPHTGPAASGALAEPSHALRTKVLGGRVAESGDLAYTYGEYVVPAATGAAEQGNYLRIWTRTPGNYWRLALDVRSPAGN